MNPDLGRGQGFFDPSGLWPSPLENGRVIVQTHQVPSLRGEKAARAGFCNEAIRLFEEQCQGQLRRLLLFFWRIKRKVTKEKATNIKTIEDGGSLFPAYSVDGHADVGSPPALIETTASHTYLLH